MIEHEHVQEQNPSAIELATLRNSQTSALRAICRSQPATFSVLCCADPIDARKSGASMGN